MSVPTAVHTEQDVKETIAAFSAIRGKLEAGAYKGEMKSVAV